MSPIGRRTKTLTLHDRSCNHWPVSAAATAVDGRVARGEQTRKAILQRAMDVASVDGLEGLSIGQLAADLGISKSGVFAHFGSKEELQLATIRAAVEVFIDHVVRPAKATPAGIRRVHKLLEAKLSYFEKPIFAGGCFFQSAAAEFNARPGRVRDAIAHTQRDWRKLYEQTVQEAVALGEVSPDVDAAQLAFELDAYVRAANSDALLYDEPEAYAKARLALKARLAAAAADPALIS